MKKFKYDFSIIMSIYNVDQYLEEAVDCLLNQTFPFERVQLILVNDGSDDFSEEICLKYQNRYPNNIIYVFKENGGLSSARNEGIKYIEGKYVNFFDPDDILEKKALENVYNFFEKNYNDVDFVALPLFFFEAMEGIHGKYVTLGTDTRIIDLYEEPYNFVLSSASSFIKYNDVIDKEFDVTLHTAEDTKFNYPIFTKKCKIGYIYEKDSLYLYRQRVKMNSMVSSGVNNPKTYYAILQLFSYIISINNGAQLPDVAKEIILYELKNRLRNININLFDSEQEYYRLLEEYRKCLGYIEDNFIVRGSKITVERIQKYVLLRLKYNNDKNLLIQKNNGDVYMDELFIYNVRSLKVSVKKIEVNDGYLIIHTFLNDYNINDVHLVLQNNNEIIKPVENTRFHTSYDLRYGSYCVLKTNYNIFKFKLSEGTYEFCILGKDGHVEKAKSIYMYENFNPLLNNNLNVKIFDKGYSVTIYKDKIKIAKENYNNFKYILKTFFSYMKRNKYLAFSRLHNKQEKKYVLINDRPIKAGDNGEALFKYINENAPEIAKETYYVISKESSDYERIKKIGNVVVHGSNKHKRLFINAKYIFSSHTAKKFYCPFDMESEISYYSDLLNFELIWLQHGITLNNIVGAANAFATNVDYIITASKHEVEEFEKPEYFFNKEKILNLGFSRFDNLEDARKQIITFAPTWRQELSGEILSSGLHAPKVGFEQSDFYLTVKSLLENKELQEFLKCNNLIFQFVLHPGFACYENYFLELESKNIKIIKSSMVNYNQLFCESSLFITDYSSTFFDFSYLRKPIIFYQFDSINFFNKHYGKGIFDYEEDGFGPVVYNENELIKQIQLCYNNNFVLAKKYLERINKCFSFEDRSSCKRIFNYFFSSKKDND